MTLDDDIAAALRELARARGGSFKQVVNEVLRKGLSTGEKPPAATDRFEVHARRRGFSPGIDPLKLNQLVDELDSGEFLEQDHAARS